MRVVLDGRVATDHFPGIGRVAVGLAEALLRVAPGLDLVVLEDTSTKIAERKPIGAPRAPVAASVFSLSQQWIVPAALRALRADIYHSLFYLMPWRPGVPSVFTCHDLIPLRRRELFPWHKRAIFAASHRAAVAATRLVLAVSKATADDLNALLGVSPDRIRVVPNGVDPGFAPPTGDAVAAMRTELGLAGDYFLFVGSNRPHKNLPLVVAAYARARSRLGAAAPRLVVAGPWDPRYPEARQAAGRLGAEQVRFLGPVRDRLLPALYGGATAFVFPSSIEGFGLPVLEAMACGAATITARSSSLPEVAGEAAILIGASDVDALASALVDLALQPGLRESMRARGLARAAEFTWDRAAELTLQAYREALERGTRA